jgi:hypothetical protein
MDRCEEDLILSNGLYIHSEEDVPQIQIKYWIPNVSRATEHEDEGEFHTQFVTLKNDKYRIFFQYFIMINSKSENSFQKTNKYALASSTELHPQLCILLSYQNDRQFAKIQQKNFIQYIN